VVTNQHTPSPASGNSSSWITSSHQHSHVHKLPTIRPRSGSMKRGMTFGLRRKKNRCIQFGPFQTAQSTSFQSFTACLESYHYSLHASRRMADHRTWRSGSRRATNLSSLKRTMVSETRFFRELTSRPLISLICFGRLFDYRRRVDTIEQHTHTTWRTSQGFSELSLNFAFSTRCRRWNQADHFGTRHLPYRRRRKYLPTLEESRRTYIPFAHAAERAECAIVSFRLLGSSTRRIWRLQPSFDATYHGRFSIGSLSLAHSSTAQSLSARFRSSSFVTLFFGMVLIPV